MTPLRTQAADYFRSLQDRICRRPGRARRPRRFREDAWQREGGGGGRTRVLADGGVFEKAGVNFSEVHGQMSEEFAQQVPGEGRDFTASGISLVLHPRSPMVPTVHANFRFLTKGDRQWFGGGADLTPYYPYREDVIHFHKTWQARLRAARAAGRLSAAQEVVRRVFLPAAPRRAARRRRHLLRLPRRRSRSDCSRSCATAATAFLEAYLPIVRRRKDEPYTAEQRAFQEYRRGRYVEFNLLYDRGTLFGLKTGGRTESILMSLPPAVRWQYDYRPSPGSRRRSCTRCI